MLGYNARLCSEVITAFTTELMRSYKSRAKHYLGLGSVTQAHTGTITFVQRFDSFVYPALPRRGPHFASLSTPPLLYTQPCPGLRDQIIFSKRRATC